MVEKNSNLVVQKYGGSSLADPDKVRRVADKIKARLADGMQMVVVVSAMGKTTDNFVQLARETVGGGENLKHNGAREMDTLLSAGELVSSSIMSLALQSIGVDAISLSGSQAGIRTNSAHMAARIDAVNTERLQRELQSGKVVVVAGFQGIGADGDVTTLGRGGSDTTAVALAVALKAERCEIYTDVAGIFTTDPRLCPSASVIKRIRADEMLELANLGAKMNPRSIELAAIHQLPIYVAATFGDETGTLIYTGGNEMEIRKTITGIAVDAKIGKIVITGVKDRPGVAAGLLKPMSEAGIGVSAIVQNTSVDGKETNFTFIVPADDVERAHDLITAQTEVVFANSVYSRDISKVSIVGTGVTNSPEYASKMFATLAEAGVNIDMITTSEISITCVVPSDGVKRAVQALHTAFELEATR